MEPKAPMSTVAWGAHSCRNSYNTGFIHVSLPWCPDTIPNFNPIINRNENRNRNRNPNRNPNL